MVALPLPRLTPAEHEDVRLLKPAEVAACLGCSPKTVYRLVQRGELPTRLLGGEIRVRYTDLRAFVQADT